MLSSNTIQDLSNMLANQVAPGQNLHCIEGQICDATRSGTSKPRLYIPTYFGHPSKGQYCATLIKLVSSLMRAASKTVHWAAAIGGQVAMAHYRTGAPHSQLAMAVRKALAAGLNRRMTGSEASVENSYRF